MSSMNIISSAIFYLRQFTFIFNRVLKRIYVNLCQFVVYFFMFVLRLLQFRLWEQRKNPKWRLKYGGQKLFTEGYTSKLVFDGFLKGRIQFCDLFSQIFIFVGSDFVIMSFLFVTYSFYFCLYAALVIGVVFNFISVYSESFRWISF